MGDDHLVREDYMKIFKELIQANSNNKLGAKVAELFNNTEIDKNKFSKIISSLCGVSLEYDENYIDNLITAIRIYSMDKKVVEKVANCDMNCSEVEGDTDCQHSCPFDAILMDKDKHNTYIDYDKCLGCGFCVDGCKNGNIMDKTEFIPISNLLRDNKTVIAAVAPAIYGQFGPDVTINQLRASFKNLGFSDMVEVAFFADMLTLKEAVEFDMLVKTKDDLMITSCCCPMWVGMLRKVYSSLVKHVTPSISPMIASGRILKQLNPNCKVVFIGPCIAKKGEAKDKELIGDIDFVLTFEEIKTIFEALDIHPSMMPEIPSIEYASKGGRIYGRTGGVSVAISDVIRELFPEKYKLLKAVQAEGVIGCREMLDKAQKENFDANFIEGMGCIGGCVGGPKVLISREDGRTFLNNLGEASDIKVAIDSDCMHEILKKLGINSIDDFRNSEKVEVFERKLL